MSNTHFLLPVGLTPAKPPHMEYVRPVSPVNMSVFAASHPIQDRATMWAEAVGVKRAGGSGPQIQGGIPSRVITVIEVDAPYKEVFQKVIESKLLVSLVVFLFTATLLVAINPPIAQKKDENGTDHGRSPIKICVWSLVAAMIALALPYTGCLPSFRKGVN